MDDQGKETPVIGGIDSPSDWRAKVEPVEPETITAKVRRFFAKLRGEEKVLVSSDGGPKQEMTAEEADAQAQAEVQAKKKVWEEQSTRIPGAKVDVDQSGETTEVNTTAPGETNPAEKEIVE